MHKNVSKRLGCVAAHGGEEAIKHHSFFKSINWVDMENRAVKPPFRPKIVRLEDYYTFHEDSGKVAWNARFHNLAYVTDEYHTCWLARLGWAHIFSIVSTLSFFFSLQKSRKDVLNFDTEFTKEEPTLTPINVEVVRTINQDEFKGFSFYNTQFGKQVGGR